MPGDKRGSPLAQPPGMNFLWCIPAAGMHNKNATGVSSRRGRGDSPLRRRGTHGPGFSAERPLGIGLGIIGPSLPALVCL